MVIKKHDLIDIKATLLHQTEKAYLITTDGKNKVWLPKSIVEYDEEESTFTMPENWAMDKELI